MAKFTWVLRAFGVCVALLLLMGGAAARPKPRSVRPTTSKFSSLSQACYGVLEDACPPAEPNRVDCLADNFYSNENHECKLWVGWRTLCLVFVEKQLVPEGLCDFSAEEATPELVRGCLRTVDKSVLPQACADSPYYKSLQLHSRRQMDVDEDL